MGKNLRYLTKPIRCFSIVILLLFPLISCTAEIKNGNHAGLKIETIQVSNETEFIRAIGSNRVIMLNPGTYTISRFHEMVTDYVSWEEVYDGFQLNISNVENLSIIGFGPVPVKIHTEATAAIVLNFINSKNITIQNVEAGHYPEKGFCQGSVFAFENSKNITIENAVLFGCGSEGLTLTKVDNLRLIRSTIKECSYGILTAYDSKELFFLESLFHDNEECDLLNFYGCHNVLFSKCEIFNNKSDSGWSFLDIHESRSIVFKNI